MTTEVVSDVYGNHVEVIHTNGRIVVGLPDATTTPMSTPPPRHS